MAINLAKRFAGKSVIITGGANGLGLAAAKRLAEEEFARVIGVNLNGVFYGMAEVLRVMAKQDTPMTSMVEGSLR